MWWNRKKSADHALKELVERLSQALGPRLLSVLLYGSRASGEFHEERSDVNVFILLENTSVETLDLLSGPMRTWTKAGHSVPVFIPKSELQVYADSLPIEFLDMQDHHKVLFGSDPLAGLNVSRAGLRAQCVQELSVKLLKLRQVVLLAKGNAKRLRDVLTASLPSVLTLYRAALRLESEAPKGNKLSAALEFSKRAGLDGDVLTRLWDIHTRRQTDNVNDLSVQYLSGIERVLTYLHRK